MGSDDLHHKRKARLAKHLARRRSKRESYDRVLIVCEGSKTELNYLRDLRDSLKLSSANIEIDGNSGSSPKSVVRYAKRRLSEEKKVIRTIKCTASLTRTHIPAIHRQSTSAKKPVARRFVVP